MAVTGGALDIANARITGTDSVINITGGELNITNAQITGKDSAINVYNGTVNIDKDTVISAEGNAVNLITPYSKNNEEDNSVDINSMDSNSMRNLLYLEEVLLQQKEQQSENTLIHQRVRMGKRLSGILIFPILQSRTELFQERKKR